MVILTPAFHDVNYGNFYKEIMNDIIDNENKNEYIPNYNS